MRIIMFDDTPMAKRTPRGVCKNQAIIMQFANSDAQEALVVFELNEYANLASARCALNQAIRSMRKSSLYKTSVRRTDDGEELYIIRKM